MTTLIDLNAGSARLVLAPSLGGAIARLDVDGKPALRPWAGDADDPFSLASNILVPFSNRIAGGAFEWRDERVDIAPNLAGEACPIHGDGFQKPWAVDQSDERSVSLTLANGAIGPYRYRARQVFSLSPGGLRVDLEVVNTGEKSLPFGCGFHPWFPRSSDTRLSFQAKGVWLEDADYLPTDHLDVNHGSAWDFSRSRPLPDGWINNGFTTWGGVAKIDQGPDFASLGIRASDTLSTAIVYSPDKNAPFFCFEPVSHPVNAFNLPDRPGLVDLEQNASLDAWMEFSWNGEAGS